MTSRRARSSISIALLTGMCGSLLATVPVAAGAATGATAPPVPVPIAPVSVLAGPKVAATEVEAPDFLAPAVDDGQNRILAPTLTTPTAVITVNYTGFTPQAQAAFQSAVDVIETLITARQPIEIDASFASLGPGVLGSAGAMYAWNLNGTNYPSPLANEVYGADLDAQFAPAPVAEIRAQFSSDRSDWWFGLDGGTPVNNYDFKSVVMHEIWHGLGFSGSMTYDPATGVGKYNNGGTVPSIYDRGVHNFSAQQLIALPNSSTALGSQLVGESLHYVGANARRGNDGIGLNPRLWAPTTWSQGSSYAHLDENTFPAGNVNSLMTYQIGGGEVVHTPGPIALGMFRDMGWNTLMVPAKVANPTATAGPNSATVSWAAPDSGGTAITKYVVTASNGASETVSGTTTSRTYTGLATGTSVSYTVQAFNAIGSGQISSPSNTATAQAPATAPSAPTGVSATAGNASAQVSWTAPNNGGSAITGYTVTSSGGQVVDVGAVTTASVPGLTNGTPYTFTVTATNAVGTSAASAASSAVTPAAVPAAPTGVAATAGNASASVSWVAPADNGSAITGYTVTSSGGHILEVTGSRTTAQVTGLVNGTSYTFTVTATNAIGTSPASLASSSVTPASSGRRPVADFDGNGTTDIAVYRPSTSQWIIRGQGTRQWGALDDIPLNGDFDGNGTTDIAVYRPSTSQWIIRGQGTWQWGAPDDIPLNGDFDGNGTTDIAVYRPSTSQWIIRGQGTWQWGAPDDIPLNGDFDGNGTTDIAVYRPSTSQWIIRGQGTRQWGAPDDIPLNGDFDGNGTTDIAVYRPSTSQWIIRGQGTRQWGALDDIPLNGDFDGNGTTDIAVYRPSTSQWIIRGQGTRQWGGLDDAPVT